ncbi:MAG: S1 RNA-binding domain-containing protein, partial [Candidatus Weimeria sp.]|nr:S1 RNA-binding domain-containing protein [Candidatus Weimeria sp.]
DRKQLLKVSKLGPKAYEQCAGFLRIRNGKNPLDNTGVHPESYQATDQLLKILGYSEEDVKEGRLSNATADARNKGLDALAQELSIGLPTLTDILKELEKPGRDPREDMPRPILRSDVLSMEDLKPGMVLKGTVRNIVDFGAFVDIGVHQDGLVHISHMTDKYISHPLEAVSVGDIVDVEVLEVDIKKQRIALTMRIGKGDSQDDIGKSKEKQPVKKDRPVSFQRGRKNGDNRRGGKGRGNTAPKKAAGKGGNKGSFGSSLGDLLSGLKLD